MPFRPKKMSRLIQQQMAEILSREIDFKPGVIVTVSQVDISADLRYTRVFVSIFPAQEAEYVLKTLEKEIYHLQGVLNKKLTCKFLPRLEFKQDFSEIQADKVEKILKEINRRS